MRFWAEGGRQELQLISILISCAMAKSASSDTMRQPSITAAYSVRKVRPMRPLYVLFCSLLACLDENCEAKVCFLRIIYLDDAGVLVRACVYEC